MEQNDKVLRYLTVRLDEGRLRERPDGRSTASRRGTRMTTRPTRRATDATETPRQEVLRPAAQGLPHVRRRSRDTVDYKDVRFLQQYVVERSKILPRRISGTCAKHQRIMQQAIKRARHLALLPFTSD